MRADITTDGVIFLKAETFTEGGLLRSFYENNYDGLTHTLRTSNIFFDWTVIDKVAPSLVNFIVCDECLGTGVINSDKGMSHCYKCNGIGKVVK